jgi:hypothetical protein
MTQVSAEISTDLDGFWHSVAQSVDGRLNGVFRLVVLEILVQMGYGKLANDAA